MRKSYKTLFVLGVIFFILYIGVILYLTLFDREVSDTYQYEWTPFWSYKIFFEGNDVFGILIMRNILLFIPFGFLLALIMACFQTRNGRAKLKKTVLLSTLIGIGSSLIIEGCQLVFKLGLFEFDDVINNGLGALIGSIVLALIWIIARGARVDK